MTPSELCPLISPKLSEKFSPNLHRYLKKRRKLDPALIVGTDPDGEQYLGRPDQEEPQHFIGLRLIEVLNKTRANSAFLLNKTVTPDPTFWDRYIKIGRCAIDPDHELAFLSSKSRYTRKGDIRTCTWCGATHRSKKIIIKRTKEIWEHISAVTTGGPKS
jgi:hypothetical protein